MKYHSFLKAQNGFPAFRCETPGERKAKMTSGIEKKQVTEYEVVKVKQKFPIAFFR